MQIDGQRVTALRKSVPLTVMELAERVGISRQAVHLIESGATQEPRPLTVRELARALGVPESELAKSEHEAA